MGSPHMGKRVVGHFVEEYLVGTQLLDGILVNTELEDEAHQVIALERMLPRDAHESLDLGGNLVVQVPRPRDRPPNLALDFVSPRFVHFGPAGSAVQAGPCWLKKNNMAKTTKRI